MVSKGLLQDLQIIIKEEYNLDISNSEIAELGNSLVTSFQILSEPEVSEHD